MGITAFMTANPQEGKATSRSDPPALWQVLGLNIVPLLGVLLFKWDAGTLLAVYWLENVVIGLFHALRLATARGIFWEKLFLVPFFLMHYGGFCAGHGVFIVVLTQGDKALDLVFQGQWSEVETIIFHGQFKVLLLAYLIINASDFLSWYKKPRTEAARDMIGAPYPRIIFLHLGLVIGGGIAMLFQSALWILLILVLAKCYYDLRVHKMPWGKVKS